MPESAASMSHLVPVWRTLTGTKWDMLTGRDAS